MKHVTNLKRHCVRKVNCISKKGKCVKEKCLATDKIIIYEYTRAVYTVT